MCFIAVSLDFLIHHRPRDFLVVLLSCLSFTPCLSSNIMKSFQTQINMSICLWIRFRSKYEPIIHNNSSSCCLSHQNPHTYLFRAGSLVNCAWSVQISDQMTFSLDKTILLIDDLYFSNGFVSCKQQLSLRMLTDEWSVWIIVMFYQLFGLSFRRHPFTAEDTLMSKWCNATFLQIWWRNKLISILDGLRIIFSFVGGLFL